MMYGYYGDGCVYRKATPFELPLACLAAEAIQMWSVLVARVVLCG